MSLRVIFIQLFNKTNKIHTYINTTQSHADNYTKSPDPQICSQFIYTRRDSGVKKYKCITFRAGGWTWRQLLSNEVVLITNASNKRVSNSWTSSIFAKSITDAEQSQCVQLKPFSMICFKWGLIICQDAYCPKSWIWPLIFHCPEISNNCLQRISHPDHSTGKTWRK